MRRARWKRKSVRAELAPHGPTHPKRGARRHELLCISGALLPAAPMQIPRITASPHLVAWHSSGCKEDTPLLLFPLPLPIPKRGFQRGGPPPAPLCPEGVWGAAASPMFLFRGSGGHSLFKREYPPDFVCRLAALPTANCCIFSALSVLSV